MTCHYQTTDQLAADPDVSVCQVHGPQPAEDQPNDLCYAPQTRSVLTGAGDETSIVAGRCCRRLVRRPDIERPACTSPLPCGGHHHTNTATTPLLPLGTGYRCEICSANVLTC